MSRSSSLRRRVGGTVAACVAIAALGGVATASTSSRTAVIHACYAKKGGALKIARRCPRGYRAISWNAVGRTGATGRQGVQGEQGLQGQQGVRGKQGPGALRLSYKRDSADPTATTLASYRGYSLSAQCSYDPGNVASATMVRLHAPTNTFVDLTGSALAQNANTGEVIGQGVVRKYHQAAEDLFLVTASAGPTRVHLAYSYGPVSVVGTGADGTLTTFALTLVLTTDAGATVGTANEGRCRVEGTLTPTR